MNVTDFMQAMNNPQAYVMQQFANQLLLAESEDISLLEDGVIEIKQDGLKLTGGK